MGGEPMNNNEHLISILNKHKEFLTSVKAWNHYSAQHSLPSSSLLIRKFGSWNNVKLAAGVPIQLNKYTKDQLIKVAIEHKRHMQTTSDWASYSTKHGLPNVQTFLKHFGSWEGLRKHMKITPKDKKWEKYSKDQIEKIIHENRAYFASKTIYNEYAKDKGLPTYNTLTSYFTWTEIKQKAGFTKGYNYSKEELISIAKTYRSYLTTVSSWNKYASENGLPTAQTFIRKFGSWRKAKAYLYE